MSPAARPRLIRSTLAAALSLLCCSTFAAAAFDAAAVDGSVTAFPGETVEIPVFALDLSLTPIGLDRPAGERIQSLAYKVTISPASSVASKLFARAGITATLTPIFEVTPTTATTASYLGTFDETTDPIPFWLDGPAPGNQVLKIVVTLAGDAPPGTITLALDPAATELANQAGSLLENQANGWLALVDGHITVLSNAAGALRSYAVSSAAIQLAWNDPDANETGFRLERSTDGASWAPVATLGPDDTSYLDATGLAPATLYYHRLVTLTPADGHVSNLAAASTFPAVAAKICDDPIAAPLRSYAFTPRAAWGGGAWGVAWYGRQGATQDEIYFRRFDATTLAPLGPPTLVAGDASPADRVRVDRPVLAWSDAGGGHWGVAWTEGLVAVPGDTLTNSTFFSLLAPDGSVERARVRVSNETNDHPWEDGFPAPLLWDGTHWGIFELAYVSPPTLDLVYRRLDEDGDVVLGPVTVLSPPAAHVADIEAAWNPATSKYGLVWTEIHDDAIDIYFQLMEESTGALEGSSSHLDDYVSVVGTYGFSVVADGTGWAAAWTDVVSDPDLGEIGVSWLRRFDATGAPLGPAMRLSDDPVTDGGVPLLASKPGGGFAAFMFCGSGTTEVCRLETDASGNRIGSLTEVSSFDGARSDLSSVAGNGTDFLALWSERGSGTYEIAGSLVPASDFSTPGAPQALTSGNDPVSGGVGNSSVVPVGAGFAAVWLDATSGSALLQARTWDGSGSTIASLAPLDPAQALGRPGVVGVGDSFAVSWRDVASGDLWFARYDVTGSPLVSRTSVSTLPGYRSSGTSMAFSGESYGIVWARNGGNGIAFLRVAPDGTPIGTEVILPVGGLGNNLPQIQWTGQGWALAWFEPDGVAGTFNLRYAFLAPDGTPLVGETAIDSTPQNVIVPQIHLYWSGTELFLAWSALSTFDPPLDDVYLTRVNLDGSLAFSPVTAASTSTRDLLPVIYWTQDDARLHLLYQPGGLAGEREVEFLADGTAQPGGRWWTDRSFGGVAWNGVTLGYVFGVDANMHFQTGACVTEDATPPPCPDLTVASFDQLVRLSWPAVSDPESGVFRYYVYRDGLPLGWTTATHFDDPGYGIGATHLYEARALDGAWMESAGCPAVSFSTTAGDANGDGVYGVADIFYLINYFFADGAPPAGNADANGDNSVTVSDIFYMINNLFSGGPPPQPLTGAGETVAPPDATAAEEPGASAGGAAGGAQPRSRLAVGSATAPPGATVRLPIELVDRPGTPLGPERPFGERVQALSFAVACSPCDGVASLAIEPAGPLARNPALFSSRPSGAGHAALVASYEESTAPLFLGLSSSKLRQPVATLVVRLAPSARPGTRLDLRLDPGATTLANQAGDLFESATNGWLELVDGTLTIGGKPTLGGR